MLIENRMRGILWMLATMASFIALDACIKLGLEHYSLVQATWGRFAFATIFACLWCGKVLPQLWRSKVPAEQTLRSFFLMITTGFFNAGLLFVPLATATTIMFLTPIVTTVLSVLVLNEHVGIRRWASIAVGFAGAVIVVQPWTAFSGSFNAGALFLVAAAFSNASYQIATRKVRIDDPRTSLLFTAAFGAVITSFILPWFWQWPSLYEWSIMAASGLTGALGHFCIIQAFRNAPASVVTPYSYSSLLWATLIGYIVWQEFPSQNTVLGASLIVASGLYIFWRERVRSVEMAKASSAN